ncbi:WD40 repeat-like protein [Pluteus cervinus]|uniref:WD40 repeat-like protein n=1 Tax=Pluteus cervinus TaxID=181527 RepID=A0ACD3ADR6_9AGAR|nr:WD40 repeat-like protein [Pluteus cervinus]
MSVAYLLAHEPTNPHTDVVAGVRWTPQSTVSISADGSIRQWSPNPGSTYHMNGSLTHPLGLVSLSSSPDGKHMLWNSVEGVTSLGHMTDEGIAVQCRLSAPGTKGDSPAWSVSLHPAGEQYASTGASGNITLRSAKAEDFGAVLSALQPRSQTFGLCCAYSPDGNRVAMTAENGEIFIFDSVRGSLVSTFTSHVMPVRTLSWTPDSNSFLSASDDTHVVLHDVRSPGGVVASMLGHSSWVLSTDWSSGGYLALSGSLDKSIKIWDMRSQVALSTILDNSGVWAVSWNPDGASGFVTGGEDGSVKWWRSAGTGTGNTG